MYGFGSNMLGQFGNGNNKDLVLPTLIEKLKNKQIISCGHYHTIIKSGKFYSL